MSHAAAGFSTAVRNAGSHLFSNQDESLARLHYLFDNQRRAGIVLGATGVGKTALLSRFAKEVRRAGHEAVTLDLYGTQDGEFLWNLATKLGAVVQPNESRLRLWRAITDRIFESRLQKVRIVLLLDNVEEAHVEVLTLLTKLIQLERSPELVVTSVLTANPTNLGRLGARLLELIDLRIELEAWSMAETVKFLESPLAPAMVDAATFTPAALERLHELSGGMPRNVSRLAELSQLAANGTEAERVESQTVDNVFTELSLGGTLTST